MTELRVTSDRLKPPQGLPLEICNYYCNKLVIQVCALSNLIQLDVRAPGRQGPGQAPQGRARAPRGNAEHFWTQLFDLSCEQCRHL